MSYTQTTEFYEIPLPQETDLVNPMDDNDAKVRVDTDLHSAVQNASSAVETANAASDAAAAATSGLEELSGIVNTEKGKLTALTARVTAAENEIDDVRGDSNDMITAFNEPTATSTHAYAIGDYFIYNDVLYKATAAIAISDTIVPNTNCEATNVTTEIDDVKSALSDLTETNSTGLPAVRIDNAIFVNVEIANGTATAGTTLGTVQESFRPNTNKVFTRLYDNDGVQTTSQFTIKPDGTLVCSANLVNAKATFYLVYTI